MTKQDEVIKALEFCLMQVSAEEIEDDACPHPDCPYFQTYSGGKCVSAMCRDALVLLKEQEPRVMTYDEVKALDGTESTVYVERQTKTFYNEMAFVNVEKVYGEGIIFHGQKSIFGHKKKDYGKKWRCWTSRPDKKVMSNTPWES